MPDSLVSSHVYEIIKTIYSTTAPSTTETTRISVIQSTLGQLRLANIATLDAISTHFNRLIELTSADEQYVAALATMLAPAVLRPKQETTLTMNEKYAYRLVRDLLANKDAIFGELKRASSITNNPQAGSSERDRARIRAISTDESNRREKMEERNRAIANRSRASSPAPGPRGPGHRRDRSVGGPETRFPIHASPTTERRPHATRQSLEVPGSADSSPVVETPKTATPGATATTNGASDEATTVRGSAEVGNRDSVGRGAARFSRPTPTVNLAKQSLVSKRDSQGSLKDGTAGTPTTATGPMGVELTDRPMDD